MLTKIYYYLRKLWHEYIICDIFIMTFSTKLQHGEILQTTYGDKIEVIWGEKEGKYWKYWVINVY